MVAVKHRWIVYAVALAATLVFSAPLAQSPLATFVYRGKLARDGKMIAVLTRQEREYREYIVQAGDTLDGIYQIEAIDDERVVLKYLPLGTRQTLSFGAHGAPVSDASPSGAPAVGAPVDAMPASGAPVSGPPVDAMPASAAPASTMPASGARVSGARVSGAPARGVPSAAPRFVGIAEPVLAPYHPDHDE